MFSTLPRVLVNFLLSVAFLSLLLLASCGPSMSVAAPRATPAPTRQPTSLPTPRPAPRPSPTPIPAPASWLKNTTLLTIYGRGFGQIPILGRLGMDAGPRDLSGQVQPYIEGIRANNGGKAVRVAIHLIYAMATPCSPGSNCLAYLDDAGVNIVKQYIRPAAQRGWLVILDDQLGMSSPATEVRRMIARGYLRYDNVEVALDPEFRAQPGQPTPGIPVGTVTGEEINTAERLISRYAAGLHLPHHKIVMIHQFQWGMIADRGAVQVHLPWIDPVIVADGFGPPGVKAHVYHDLLSRRNAPRFTWRGIKLFFFNPYEQAGHGDSPTMSWAQVMGRAPAMDIDGLNYWVSPAPNVVVVA